MNCPTDGTTLLMSERQGIEIDYCPQCRGVWLDRGELDKIIERVQSDADAAAPQAPPTPVAPVTPTVQAVPPAARPQYEQQPYSQQSFDPRRDNRQYRDSDDRRHYDARYDNRGGYRKKPKRPMDWLGELFD